MPWCWFNVAIKTCEDPCGNVKCSQCLQYGPPVAHRICFRKCPSIARSHARGVGVSAEVIKLFPVVHLGLPRGGGAGKKKVRKTTILCTATEAARRAVSAFLEVQKVPARPPESEKVAR